MKTLTIKAPAKVNLGLDVLRRREDGYHEVRMIMQNVDIYDELVITASDEPGIRITVNLDWLSVGEDNLIYKAAKMLMEEFAISSGVDIALTKNIPVAAGMAGGSTDAAATLIGINQIFDLGLSDEDLMKRGVKIGADVPYCIMRTTALSEGIGEILTPLKKPPVCSVVVAKPEISVSTKFVYTNLKLTEDTIHPDIDGMIKGIEDGDYNAVASRLGNVLETVTIPAYPIIADIKKLMIEEGADASLMSGSGPTVFGLFRDEAKAAKCVDAINESGMAKQVFLTHFVNQGESL